MAKTHDHSVDEIDQARRLANTRAVAALAASIGGVLGIYVAIADGDRTIGAVFFAIAASCLLPWLGASKQLAPASVALVVLPLAFTATLSMARGYPRLSVYWAAIAPLIAGLVFGPPGVAVTFLAAAGTILACYAFGVRSLEVIQPEHIMLSSLAVACICATAGLLASSSTLRALQLARRRGQQLAEGERRHRQRLLHEQEKERGAIARELHDDFGQLLTAARMTIESGRGREAIGVIDEAIDKVRNLALSLRPAVLDHLGLVEALRSFVARQAERSGFEVELVVIGEPSRQPEEVETACFRLVQEALTNVARHAGARRVSVRLESSPAGVELSVQDDGRGFDFAAARARAASGGSLGLPGMEERVALAGGQFEIVSAPGQGTTLRARFERPAR